MTDEEEKHLQKVEEEEELLCEQKNISRVLLGKRRRLQVDEIWLVFENYVESCVANALIKRCQSTALIVTATPKGSKGELGAWRTSEFDDSGTASGHFEKPSQ